MLKLSKHHVLLLLWVIGSVSWAFQTSLFAINNKQHIPHTSRISIQNTGRISFCPRQKSPFDHRITSYFQTFAKRKKIEIEYEEPDYDAGEEAVIENEEEYEYIEEEEELGDDEEYEYVYEVEEDEEEEDIQEDIMMEYSENYQEEADEVSDAELQKIDPDYINIDKEYFEVLGETNERKLQQLLAQRDAEAKSADSSSMLSTRPTVTEEEAEEYLKVLRMVKEQVYDTPEKLAQLKEDAMIADLVMSEYAKVPERVSGPKDIIPDGMTDDDAVILEAMDPTTNQTTQFATTKDELQKFGETIQSLRELEEDMAKFKHRIDFMDVDAAMTALDDDAREDIIQFDVRFSAGEGGIDLEDFEDNRREHLFNYQFNVTNLLLSSLKVNPDAPAIKEEWMEALRFQKKYEHVREKMDFNFTWDDVEAANVTELQEYWRLTGVDEIPMPTRRENPNVVSWDDNPLTFEEEQMLSLEAWYDEVYQEEDDDMLEEEVDELEAFAESDDKQDPTEVEVEKFEKKWADESEDWKRQFYTKYEYEHSSEETFETKQFRGHLVVACADQDEDLNMAQIITARMEKEFGPQVFVETRVHAHAKPDDSIFEIWLESWDIDLLHSKRRATFDRDWEGPKVVDETQLASIVDRVKFLISDEARFSFNFNEFADVVEG